MFKRLKISVPVAALLALSLTLFSCSKEEEEVDTVHPEITFTQNPAEAKAGSQFVSVKAGSEWTVSIAFSGEQEGWAAFDESKGNGSVTNLKFRYTANTSAESRYLTVTLKSKAGTADVEFRQYGTGEKVVGNYGAAVATQSWLELPSTDASDGMEFFTHYMKFGSKEVRNYSFYYSYDDLVSIWVAYPLNKGLIGSYFGRADSDEILGDSAFNYDPLLPESCQQYVSRTYGTGYTRGHQIASADRQATLERNLSTYYATNMTPQEYDFNSGIWAKLEGAVRALSQQSDTLYVVTGAVLGSNKTSDRMGHKIAVPDAYFKALLFYGTGYGKFSNFSAVGIYMDHDPNLSGALKSYAMSIDELEDRTGVEFFVNLPGKVGSETAKKIKAQQPSWLPSSWN